MKNNNYLLPLVAAVTLILGLILGSQLVGDTSTTLGNTPTTNAGKKLLDIFDILESDYVDTIQKESLMEQTITDLLHKLDPHSNYIPAEELLRMTESIEGSFKGVGVRFAIIRDTLCITNVISDSPADQAGIKQFDQFIAVDDSVIAGVGLQNRDVQKLLKGPEGTSVKVGVLRNGQTQDIVIYRGSVPIRSVVAAHMITDEIGYIRLSEFSMTSDREFYEAAFNLQQKGMKRLIFDLRYNGGGVMGGAVNIVDAFLEKGLPIVSTKGKRRGEEIEYARSVPFLGDVELVILINQSSASASEIVAGAIQDNDRGLIVGRRSFGKGLVQQDIQLKDSSNLRLTTSRYYTPTGRSIQKPYSGDYEEYIMDEMHRFETGELYAIDSSLFVDSLKYLTPKGRAVYGGGGIMPDVFVPLDTTGSSYYYRQLQYSGVFGNYAYDFVRENLTELGKYVSPKHFYKEFNLTEKELVDFLTYAEEAHEIAKDQKGLAKSKNRIITDLKGEIARQIWLEDGAFYVRNQTDKEFLKALEAVQDLEMN